MPKQIETLVQDIYALFDGDPGFVISDEQAQEFGHKLAGIMKGRLTEKRGHSSLRMSNAGKPCDRQLWYDINAREVGEPLDAPTKIKFLFGDILEALLLFLAEQAGHTVTGAQEKMSYGGIEGHRDAVIDGVLVDAKSASTFSYKKFKEGGLVGNDPFGYLDQLNLYHRASDDVDPDKFAFLVIDKTLGNICLDIHKPDTETDYADKIAKKIAMVNGTALPSRAFEDVPDGKSGNRKLDTNCSYCNYKTSCWPGLRTFAYSGRPRFLTKVSREPKVSEPSNEF